MENKKEIVVCAQDGIVNGDRNLFSFSFFLLHSSKSPQNTFYNFWTKLEKKMKNEKKEKKIVVRAQDRKS